VGRRDPLPPSHRRGRHRPQLRLHVARLAGIPPEVVARAKQILADLDHLTPEVERRTQLAIADGDPAAGAARRRRVASDDRSRKSCGASTSSG
jgi:hypothetical protein